MDPAEDVMAQPRRTRRSATRERFREQVREDVKLAGLRQLAEGGPQALSVNGIAKELGVSGPALYRYFANRDELLTALVLDAYTDFAAALDAATHPDLGLGPRQALRAFGRAWRTWAIEQPHRYSLLYAPPVPGYAAHAPDVVAQARLSMRVLLRVLAPLEPPRWQRRTDVGHAARTHAELLRSRGTDEGHLRWAMHVWSRLHGIVSLELGGNFASPFIQIDPGTILDDELDDMLDG